MKAPNNPWLITRRTIALISLVALVLSARCSVQARASLLQIAADVRRIDGQVGVVRRWRLRADTGLESASIPTSTRQQAALALAESLTQVAESAGARSAVVEPDADSSSEGIMASARTRVRARIHTDSRGLVNLLDRIVSESLALRIESLLVTRQPGAITEDGLQELEVTLTAGARHAERHR